MIFSNLIFFYIGYKVNNVAEINFKILSFQLLLLHNVFESNRKKKKEMNLIQDMNSKSKIY